ncbi:hypothetical protein NQ318_003185 [Aromia moschata]|uniref:Transmembrane protein n=1 Tax=Aromia moschata TaxID=1265417 RepID=A0AAV8YI33_9CUCU|nr:hypothetical protein NQ318_003185 [Aromia moschata]
MGLGSYRKNLGRVAAVLGILQGVSWTFLTLVAIIIHYWQPAIETGTTYTRLIQIMLYSKFLVDDGSVSGTTFILNPNNFVVIMWIYFVISVLWDSFSVDMLTAINHNKKRRAIVERLWGILTLFISLLDLVVTILLATDYAACGNASPEGVTMDEFFCYTSVGIAMTIAGRGFTLWVVNIVLSIVLFRETYEDIREDDSNASVNTPKHVYI